MAEGSLYLPARAVLSMSAPPGDLSLFASGWRLTLQSGVAHELSFHLHDGTTLKATLDGTAPTNELWGNRDALWLSGATSLTLLPPLEAEAATGGTPLPIG